MTGVLYGIGVGPGDPELLTLKAARTIRMCDLILVPGESYPDSVAYRIAVQAVPELAGKDVRAIPMPMTRDENVLEESHGKAAGQIMAWLDEGRCVGVLNLGDITLYSTYIYLHRRITAAGYRTGLVNGIPSFLAAAARLNIGLANGSEALHIVPVPEQAESGIEQSGTKIMMKMGSRIGTVKELLREKGLNALMVERCGMEGERVYTSTDEIPEDADYFSLIIVKE